MEKEEYAQFVNLLFSESERATVIVGAAYIDDMLLDILKAKMPALNSDSFDYNGPMGTFSSRITMAHGLGIISASVFSQINLLRKIRNDCAHGLSVIDFNKGSISGRIVEIEKPFKDDTRWLTIVNEAKQEFGISGNDCKLRLLMAFILGRLLFTKRSLTPIDSTSAIEDILPSS